MPKSLCGFIQPICIAQDGAGLKPTHPATPPPRGLPNLTPMPLSELDIVHLRSLPEKHFEVILEDLWDLLADRSAMQDLPFDTSLEPQPGGAYRAHATLGGHAVVSQVGAPPLISDPPLPRHSILKPLTRSVCSVRSAFCRAVGRILL